MLVFVGLALNLLYCPSSLVAPCFHAFAGLYCDVLSGSPVNILACTVC